MEENSKKRRKKTNTPQNEIEKSAKMNTQSLNKSESINPELLEFSVKGKVEGIDEPEPEALNVPEDVEKSIKTEEMTLEDSIEESQANSTEVSEEASIDEPEDIESIEDEASMQYKITDDVLREEFDLVSQGTTSRVDKLLEIYIRNMLGRKQGYMPQSSLDEILQEKLIKWRMWHLTFPDIREAPIMYLCCVCDMGFWHFSEFREHIIDHKDLNYNIETQNHDFRLIAHQGSNFEHRNTPDMSICWKCGKDVSVHLRADYKCDGCDKTHHNCTLLSLHEGTCEPYKEIYRQKGVDTFKSYTCPVCPYRHWEEKELERHMTSHTVRSDLPILWTTKHCPKCSLAFQDYRVHECLNQQCILWCDYCSMKFQSKVMLAIHLSNSKVNAQCGVCNFYLKRGCIEAEHLLTHTETYVMLYKCSLCTYQFYFLDFKSLNDHRIIKHFHSKKEIFFDKVIAPRSLLKKDLVSYETTRTIFPIPSTIEEINKACLLSAITQENPDRYRITTSNKAIKTYTNKRKIKQNEVTEVQINNGPTEDEIEFKVVNIKDEMMDIDENEVKTESEVRGVNNEGQEESNESMKLKTSSDGGERKIITESKSKKRKKGAKQFVGKLISKAEEKIMDEIQRQRRLKNIIKCKRYRERKKLEKAMSRIPQQVITVDEEILLKLRKERDVEKLNGAERKRTAYLINL